jgi:methylmalonyl-CoA/ethylmalonyl-CoA epimerase
MERSMVKKIEHIGVVVKDLETSMKRYAYLLGLEVKEIEEVKVKNSMNKVAFIPVGEVNIELIQTSGQIALAKDFNRETDIIHHIAFEVEDLDKTFKQLQSQGVEFVFNEILEGSRGSKFVFFKQEEFNGIYIEIVQKH